VVAGEVKNLSHSASEFTAEIDARIAAMSQQVTSVTAAMSGVAAIIQRIRGMQDSIAAAVKVQTATTEKIAASIGETAAGCRGDAARPGIHAMSLELSGLAESLEALCRASGPGAMPARAQANVVKMPPSPVRRRSLVRRTGR
jgi:methyl-accepting chemotaxis protein